MKFVGIAMEEELLVQRGKQRDAEGLETGLTQSKVSSRSNVLTARKHSSILSFVNPNCSKIPQMVATLATTFSSDSYKGRGDSSSVEARARAMIRRC